MKYKITEGSSIYLAGVASYENVENSKSDKTKTDWNFDFDFTKDINIDTEAIKSEAKKIKDEIKKQAPFLNSSFYTGTTKGTSTNESENSTQDSSGSKTNKDFKFDFNETMKDFGKGMERWGKGFEKTMKSFGETMEKFGEEFEKHWTNEYKYEDYDSWQLKALFDEMYANNETIQKMNISPKLYFEVVAYDLDTDLNDQLKFVGCQIAQPQNIPFHFVQHQLSADKWLILKLTKEEYADDWMNKALNLDVLKDYNMEEYFIIRHFKDPEVSKTKKIKLYVPLTSK